MFAPPWYFSSCGLAF